MASAAVDAGLGALPRVTTLAQSTFGWNSETSGRCNSGISSLLPSLGMLLGEQHDEDRREADGHRLDGDLVSKDRPAAGEHGADRGGLGDGEHEDRHEPQGMAERARSPRLTFDLCEPPTLEAERDEEDGDHRRRGVVVRDTVGAAEEVLQLDVADETRN